MRYGAPSTPFIARSARSQTEAFEQTPRKQKRPAAERGLSRYRSRERNLFADRGGRAAPATRRFLLGLLFARFSDQCLARQPDLVALDRKHLHQHLVTQF